MNKRKKIYLYPVTIEAHKEGGFYAKCPKLQGAWADGDTVQEAIANLKDVIRHILDYRRTRDKEATALFAVPSAQAKSISDLNVAVHA